MTQQSFAFGDQVRHPTRPEWGVGSVSKVETLTIDGRPAQRLSVRFPGQGVKVLNTGYVQLSRVGGGDAAGGTPIGDIRLDEPPAAEVIRSLDGDDWRPAGLATDGGLRLVHGQRERVLHRCFGVG